MQTVRLRPRSRYTLKLPQQEVLNRIDEQLKKRKFPLTGIVVQEHAFIRIPEKDQHYWSPEMHVWVREEEKVSIIYSVIGPKPKIWTLFIFAYTVVLVSTFFGSSYGIIQYFLGIKADFLWSIPIGLSALALVYGAAYYGQLKGREQMLLLNDFINDALFQREQESIV
jgi:hypothetical protein